MVYCSWKLLQMTASGWGNWKEEGAKWLWLNEFDERLVKCRGEAKASVDRQLTKAYKECHDAEIDRNMSKYVEALAATLRKVTR